MKSTMHESQRKMHDFSSYPAVVDRLKKAGLVREAGAPHTGRIIKFPEPGDVSREAAKAAKENSEDEIAQMLLKEGIPGVMETKPKPKRMCIWCGSRHKPLPDGACARCGRPYRNPEA